METKISQGSMTKVLDASTGVVEAFVNTMEVVDFDGDIISKGAFDNSLASLPIPVLASHDQSEVVGKVLSARSVVDSNDDQIHRLHATMQMNLDTQAGREAFSNVSGDYVREWSVGFNMQPNGSKIETIDGAPVRVINDLDWVEASTVIRGASPHTQTISAKTTDKDDTTGHETPSAPDTATEAASGTEDVVETNDYTWLSELSQQIRRDGLELVKLRLKLAQAKKE